MTLDPEILDCPFHGAALAALVEVACESQASRCPLKTRERAYRYYEAALAKKNAAKLGD